MDIDEVNLHQIFSCGHLVICHLSKSKTDCQIRHYIINILYLYSEPNDTSENENDQMTLTK